MTIAGDRVEAQHWQDIVDLLIPVAKALPTEKGVELASLGIQVHGGAGYTSAYPLEQYMRDSKVACIFEGTTGIQAMDFALRKVHLKEGAVFRDFLTEMDDVIDRAATMAEWVRYVDQLRMTRDALLAMRDELAEVPIRNRLRDQLLSATPLLEVAGDLIVAYFLLWSAVTADARLAAMGGSQGGGETAERPPSSDEERLYLAGKAPVARFFIATMLPRADGKLAAMKWNDVSACNIDVGSLVTKGVKIGLVSQELK